MLEFLNSNNSAIQASAAAIQAVAMVVLVFITRNYAMQTRRTVEAMQSQTTIMQSQTTIMQMPILDFSAYSRDGQQPFGAFAVKNIGKGAALNIKLEIARINGQGEPTKIRELRGDAQRGLLNLAENDEDLVYTRGDMMSEYQTGEVDPLSGEVKGEYALIGRYEDMNGNSYHTKSDFRDPYILVSTTFGEHEKGKFAMVRFPMS